jgi:hypothetical protein
MDALFSLADIELRSQGRAAYDHAVLVQVREMIFRAHDLSHDEELHAAADVLHEAAELLQASGVRVPAAQHRAQGHHSG